jgi:beta-lactamase regulating signal transducer with metallopeptidase domain
MWLWVIGLLIVCVVMFLVWLNRDRVDEDGSPKRLMNDRKKSVKDLIDGQK